MSDLIDRFLKPESIRHKQYEALRAVIVDKMSIKQAAQLFGFSQGSLRNLKSQFVRNPDQPFFLPDPRGRNRVSDVEDRDKLIIRLRKEQNLSAAEIAEILTKQGRWRASESTVSRALNKAGIPKLSRRHPGSIRPETAPSSDRQSFDLSPRKFRTPFAGLFLFAADLARLDFDQLVEDHAMPGSRQIPAGCALRALLALKLWGTRRASHVNDISLDPGLGLFCGLNAIPKRSTLTEYSCRVEPGLAPPLMQEWHRRLHSLGPRLGGGSSFDLDFHTIPYHGDDALTQKHYVSKRSRRQKGVLSCLVRDAEAHLFSYGDSTVRKEQMNDAVFRFINHWKECTGALPGELVFDGGFTTYANLARLEEMGIAFITLRRRSPKLLAATEARPASDWRRINLTNVGRQYRTPRILDERVRLKDYPDGIRQIAIRDLGHERPTFLITNQNRQGASHLVDRYARRMVIENSIADAIDFFHMDALSSAVAMNIHLDLQLTIMASGLYRLLACRVGQGFESAKANTIFRKLVHASGNIEITDDRIIVNLGRRANNPLLLGAKYHKTRQTIPWLGDRTLEIKFS